jgi:multiple sugar transport system ATP-binding protein
LRLVAGLQDPTSGQIRIGGREMAGVPPRDRDVGMVFQRHNLYPHLTVRANLEFSGKLRSDGWLRQLSKWINPKRYQELREINQLGPGRVAEIARWLGLEPFLDRYPRQISGGEQQRTALGRVMVRQPAVYLLDEPLSQLDGPLRAELRRQLHLLHQRLQATMLYVTHDQMEAMALGERVVVLEKGSIHQADKPEQIYHHPQTRFVAGFIGWPPMNLIDGGLTREKGTVSFRTDEWSIPLPGDKINAAVPASEQGVTLGIRPEKVRLGTAEGLGTTLSMEVVLIEHLGSEELITLRRGETRIICRMNEKSACNVGETVIVGFLMKHLHWFHRSNGWAMQTGSG